MDLITLLSSIVYGLFVFASFFKKGPIRLIPINEQDAKNFFIRVLARILFLPIMGILFNIIGYIGKFLLAPFKFLQF